MNAPSPLTWFEIPVNDLSRATAFYETVLNSKLRPLAPNMSVFPYTLGHASGCLTSIGGRAPSREGTLIYLDTRDVDGGLDAALARALESGGKPILPRTDIAEHGFIAVFEDCEGNAIGLHAYP